MELQEAKETIEDMSPVDKELAAGTEVELWSGGIRDVDGKGTPPAPALFVKISEAVWSWFETADSYLNKQLGDHVGALRWRWVEEPRMEWSQMTVQDRNGTHRVVSDRCAVYAKVMVSTDAGAKG